MICVWHFFQHSAAFIAKLYLVLFVWMQSQRRLQEGTVGVVMNFLARQRGSYVIWPFLHAATWHQHQQQMSISLDAAAARTAEWVQRHRTLLFTILCAAATRRSLTHSLPSLYLGHSHDWSVSLVVRGGRGGRNIGHWYCLRGAGYTTVCTVELLFYWKHDFVQGVGMCGLYTQPGYLCKNTVLFCDCWWAHHNRFTALFPGPPRWASARRELLDFMVQGRLTEADTPTIRLGATPSGVTSARLHHPPIFYRRDAPPAAQPTVSNH